MIQQYVIEDKVKKTVLIIINPYRWYTSPVQIARYYVPKGVKYIVK